MTLLLTVAATLTAIVVMLVTSIQLLYLESLRIRARELPALQFFKETLEAKIGLDMERGALTFSLVKHLSLAVLGVLTLGVTIRGVKFEEPMAFPEALAGALFITAGATIVCAYIVPQLVYRKSKGLALLTLVPMFRLLALTVRPLIWGLEFLQSLFDLGGQQPKGDQPRQEEHIEALISAGAEEGILEEGDRALIQSVVAFNAKTVREVMTPRPRIVAISQDATLEELRNLVITEQFSRIPAYDRDIDSIAGFVHVRDMFEVSDEQRPTKKVREILRPIRAVPESKAVNDLLREMQEEGAHMAVVVDEYGSTAGIVTLEDMVEEIVGEIHDEHEPERDCRQESDGSYVVSGSFDIGRLEALVGFRPEQDTESTTIGGLVTEWMGHVPAVGEEMTRDGIALKVLAGNNLRVDQVRITKLEPKPTEEK